MFLIGTAVFTNHCVYPNQANSALTILQDANTVIQVSLVFPYMPDEDFEVDAAVAKMSMTMQIAEIVFLCSNMNMKEETVYFHYSTEKRRTVSYK